MHIDSTILTYIGFVIFLAVAAGGYYGYTIWNRLRPNYMRIYLRSPDNTMHAYWILTHTSEGATTVVINGATYSVLPNCIERMTKWRIPTAWYVVGNPTPLNWGTLELAKGMTADQTHEALESHVIRDALSTFVAPSLFTPSLALAIAGAMILGALALGYYYVDGEMASLKILMAEIARKNG